MSFNFSDMLLCLLEISNTINKNDIFSDTSVEDIIDMYEPEIIDTNTLISEFFEESLFLKKIIDNYENTEIICN